MNIVVDDDDDYCDQISDECDWWCWLWWWWVELVELICLVLHSCSFHSR
jgi:hypothetical protein